MRSYGIILQTLLAAKDGPSSPPARKRVPCFENHYGKLAQLSSPVRNSLIQKGLLKRTISVQSSWVLVSHSSRWYWMAEQGSDMRRGVGVGAEMGLPDICHANHTQPVGSSQNPESIAQGNNLGASPQLRWVTQVSQVPANTFSAQGNSQNPGSTQQVHLWLVGPRTDHPARPAWSQRSITSLLKTCRGRAAPGWVQMSNCTRTFQAEFNFLLLTQGPGEQQLPQTAPKMHINRGIIPYYKGMHA